MLVIVGNVIVFSSNLPSIQPMMMNPFMLVIDPETITLFSPVIASLRVSVGNVKNWISSDCICIVSGKLIKSAVEVIILVEVELRASADRILALVSSTAIE